MEGGVVPIGPAAGVGSRQVLCIRIIAREGVRTRILNTDIASAVARVASVGPQEPTQPDGRPPGLPLPIGAGKR